MHSKMEGQVSLLNTVGVSHLDEPSVNKDWKNTHPNKSKNPTAHLSSLRD